VKKWGITVNMMTKRMSQAEDKDEAEDRQNQEVNKQNFFLRKIHDLINSTPVSWRYVLIVFITVRILASAAAVIGVSGIRNEPIPKVPGYEKPIYGLDYEMTAGVWERADALWYISIAKFGYEGKKSRSVFMPLYPIMIRTVTNITGLPWLSSALLISNLFFIFALYFVYKLAEIEKGEEIARRAIWYQALFPGSLFFLAPYTESVFLALAAGSFYAAKQKKWWIAGIAGAFLSAARNIGGIIIIPLAMEFLRQRKDKEPVQWKHAGWLMVIPVGLLSYMFYWWLANSNPLTFVQAQNHWARSFSFPLVTIGMGIQQAYYYFHNYPGAVYLLEAASIIIMLALGAFSFATLPASYGAFIFLGLLPALMAPFPGRALMSCMRFSAVLFPAFIVLADLTRNENIIQAIKLVFAGLFGISVALYVTSLFMI
jgi:hypothetical protein